MKQAGDLTGGFVYRGTAIPDLVGSYIFGDWSSFEEPSGGCLCPSRRPARPVADRRADSEGMEFNYHKRLRRG